MPDRTKLVSSFFFLSSLTMLACLLVGPIRTSRVLGLSSPVDCVLASSPLPSSQDTILDSAPTTTGAILEEDALPYEIEEQERADAIDESRVAFLIPASFRFVADRKLIVPLSISTLYPLRC